MNNVSYSNQQLKEKFDGDKIQKATLIAGISAIILAIAKIFLFFMTGSFVIALSAWDSSMDVIVTLINRKIVKFARLEADDNHPYGHGRAESIAALGQGALIMGGAIAVIAPSIRQIFDILRGHPVTENHVSLWQVFFFIGAAFASFIISKWLLFNGKKFNSLALQADSTHYKVDFVVNLATALGIFFVVYTKNSLLDPIIACFFSLYIIIGTYSLIKASINEIMDHDIPEEVKKAALQIISQTDYRIVDIHRLRGRKSGHRYFFDFHVTLPDELTFLEVHDVIENIEKNLVEGFGGDVVVHADPLSIRSLDASY